MSNLPDQIFAPGFKEQPFWWDAAPRPADPMAAVPQAADAVVIGSGYTGMSAALTLSRAGRAVVVCEAGDAGAGASSRNAGFIGRTLKHTFSELLAECGERKAVAIYNEMREIFDFIIGLVSREAINCSLTRCGRFIGALSPRHFEEMTRDWEQRRRHLGDDFGVITKAEQHREIGSDLYFGGILIPDHHRIDPGLFHLGLLRKAIAAGTQVLCHTPVLDISREATGLAALTTRGTIYARDVIIATNGYTGKLTPDLRRRVVPFHGYMIATEALPTEQFDRVLPTRRIFHDSATNLVYIRPAGDDTRVLFGGLTGPLHKDLRRKAASLYQAMTKVAPDLQGVRISHVWTGKCAATFDLFPHTGVMRGLHYAMGYCFGGLTMGTWLGHKTALRIIGDKASRSVFDGLAFPTRFYHQGYPWFVPLATQIFNWKDRQSL
jgi:glycine/D-amino acid oxidase-like deaminating enzyme